MKIAVLGSTGMLGKTVLKFFDLYNKDIELIIPKRFNIFKKFEFLKSLKGADYVVNCVGAIPQRMPNIISEEEEFNFFKINYLLPEILLDNDFKVIQPCTDCVFKGDPKSAPYSLNSKFDCVDSYGKSKAKLYSSQSYLKNINSIKVIRSSIVGIDKLNKSLYSWSLSQVLSSRMINGYINHLWNGITTLKWAEICNEIINNFDSYQPISIFGTNTVSKYELIKNILITNQINPDDYLQPIKAEVSINKTLDIGENNLGNIYSLLKELVEFEMIKWNGINK